MPATAARASFIKSEFRIVKNGPNATVVAKYGDSARRTKETIPTFFEVEADAQAMCDERAALLSGDRRRFDQSISGEQTGMGINYVSGSPTVNVIDDDRLANHNAVISDLKINFTKETTQIESWG